MIKASQEKQMFMCISVENISIAITKVHSERKKPKYIGGKSEHRQNKNQTKPNQESAMKPPHKKSTAFISVLFGNFLLFVRW